MPESNSTPGTVASAEETDLIKLIEFLRDTHNAAPKHDSVDIGNGQFLNDLFADPASLIAYLKASKALNDGDETGNALVIPGNAAGSALVKLITRVGHPMKSRFALPVPVVNKTGVEIVTAWINSLT